MSLSDYTTHTLLERSREVRNRHADRVLSDTDRELFLALLAAPANPNIELARAAEAFKQAVRRGTLKV